MTKLKAIETKFLGYKFRSRLEARWAVFFHNLGIKFDYEPQGFELKSGRYLPDFFLPEFNVYAEIKPPGERTKRAIYLAGKMTNWRDGFAMQGHRLTGLTRGDSHSLGLHGADDNQQPCEVVESCMEAIRKSNTMFAWLDSPDAYGALVEIGYGKGLGLDIYCVFSTELIKVVGGKSSSFSADVGHGCMEEKRLHDLWFIEEMATDSWVSNSPQELFDEWLGPAGDEEKKCAELSAGGYGVWLFRGDPVEAKLMSFAGGRAFARDELLGQWLLKRKPDQIALAAGRARAARFEHGECPV